jgi:hypothetical protein
VQLLEALDVLADQAAQRVARGAAWKLILRGVSMAASS